jgi:hypothetical protein
MENSELLQTEIASQARLKGAGLCPTRKPRQEPEEALSVQIRRVGPFRSFVYIEFSRRFYHDDDCL